MKITILNTISDSELQKIINENYSFSGILRKLNLSESSGYYRKILRKRMENLDCSLFLKKRDEINIFENNWKMHEDSDLFKLNSVAGPTTIRTRYKKLFPQEKCSICGCSTVYNNKPLELHLDHINGNNKDNVLDNLRWVCPNCHSQTSTYTGKNKKNGTPGGN